MQEKIEEGEIVVYYTNGRMEMGRVARITMGKKPYRIVPMSKSSYVKDRKYSEFMTVKKIQKIVGKNYLLSI